MSERNDDARAEWLRRVMDLCGSDRWMHDDAALFRYDGAHFSVRVGDVVFTFPMEAVLP